MLLDRDCHPHAPACADAPGPRPGLPFEEQARRLPLVRRLVKPRECLVHAGQPSRSIYFVHAGCFKVSITSADGREKVTGFRMRGELIGLDAIGSSAHGSDVVALETGEAWEIPLSLCGGTQAGAEWLRDHLTLAMAGEIRRDWQWMLSLSTLSADQRVVTFLLDLAERQRALGYSLHQLTLRMTRADLGNFLALQLETVTRSLSRLAAAGLIEVRRRDIRIVSPECLRLRAQDAPCRPPQAMAA